MRVIIIHYHLNPGGVSRIIEAQVKGMRSASSDLDIMIKCGNANNLLALHGVSIAADSSLYYNDFSLPGSSFAETVTSIVSFITKGLSDFPVLHFHNPGLGKNPALTMAAYILASNGYPVVNHCHDFPEDRPANLALLESEITGFSHQSLHQVMYPTFPWCHFVVLNSCDYDRMLQLGLSAAQIHLLPNPVLMPVTKTAMDKKDIKKKICNVLNFDQSKKICTYPVRAIERKNLGEFILIAALFSDIAHFAITLPPKNPLELPGYFRWKTFCLGNGLAIKFEAGEMVNHEELINISDFCITTSLREGFGMAYLEPWLAGTPVIGRELPCIVGDLKKYGIEFPRLYRHILVETAEGVVDFKDIMPGDQENIIRGVITQPEFKLKLFHANPFLLSLFDDIPSEIIRNNQQVIKNRFSIEEYGKELLAIYSTISR